MRCVVGSEMTKASAEQSNAPPARCQIAAAAALPAHPIRRARRGTATGRRRLGRQRAGTAPALTGRPRRVRGGGAAITLSVACSCPDRPLLGWRSPPVQPAVCIATSARRWLQVAAHTSAESAAAAHPPLFPAQKLQPRPRPPRACDARVTARVHMCRPHRALDACH